MIGDDDIKPREEQMAKENMKPRKKKKKPKPKVPKLSSTIDVTDGKQLVFFIYLFLFFSFTFF